jgi:hypothetical protein
VLVLAANTTIQFIKGVPENCVPDVRLTRSRDGSSGAATFFFENPDVFEANGAQGDITGLYLSDEEGVLSTARALLPRRRQLCPAPTPAVHSAAAAAARLPPPGL